MPSIADGQEVVKMTGESIFKITEDIVALESIMGRLEDEDLAAQAGYDLDAFLTHVGPESKVETLLAEKVDGYVSFYRHLEATAKAIREEEKHLAKLRQAHENRMKRLKEAVKFVAERLGRSKLEGKIRTVTISTSKRPAIDIVDEEAVPQQFKELVPASWRILRANIANHVTDTGEIPPGVETRQVITVKFR